jgi:hypothetical protein
MMLEPKQQCWISGWGATYEKGEALGYTSAEHVDRALGSEMGGPSWNPGSVIQWLRARYFCALVSLFA